MERRLIMTMPGKVESEVCCVNVSSSIGLIQRSRAWERS